MDRERPAAREHLKHQLVSLVATSAGSLVVATATLAGSAPATAAPAATREAALETRIKEVREQFKAATENPSIPDEASKYLAWWGNWHPWWHNWPNWHNWGNWRNG